MFKWLKRILGTEITDSVTVTPPVAAAVEPVVITGASAETGTVTVGTKSKRTRTKKADSTLPESEPKRTARSTPPKQAKVSK